MAKYNFGLSETEKAYIAGIVDGEGSIYIRCQETKSRRKRGWSVDYDLRLVVGNTDRGLIEYLYSKFGGHIQVRKPRSENHQTIYAWTVAAVKAYEILESIYPFCIVKRKQVEIARHFQATKQNDGRGAFDCHKLQEEVLRYRHDLMTDLRQLNRFKGKRVKEFIL